MYKTVPTFPVIWVFLAKRSNSMCAVGLSHDILLTTISLACLPAPVLHFYGFETVKSVPPRDVSLQIVIDE